MSAPELLDVVVGRVVADGERVVLVELLPDGAGHLPPFEAGAHVDLHVGGFVRQYSLLGSDDDPDRYVVGVLRERAGRGGSAAVHDTVRPGTRLQVSAPRNTFALDPDAEHSVLVAGGIGLTPLVAMAERLHREGRSFELHVYTRSPGTLPLAAHLGSRPWRDRVVTHFSSYGDSFRGNAPAVVPRPRPGFALYVCGPLGLTASATACASALEWPRADVHVEHFERSVPVETGGEAFTVVAASSGRAMPVGEDETIAAVLQRHGYDVVLSCEQGICGSCLTGVVDGVPEHRDEVQTADEHAANTQVNVCCSRSQTPVLTLAV
ncbi:PDR/VanB family oxidoreductase [Luteimicrobium xylanilyticum]|uniref:Tetrachlorobenzoquinone reductase n=1 Tax=Luteimicrobium xylanilyticum TaxID=1133546 RepID=A0A5P9QGJ0_9MICO|nr:PDR/VanB family oxidoreductase [Luteimicrobium xylanilyticum]QFU99565.1 Tetrachlorobenzoquinone reductase [Luteimicrobium xylanilyticum]